LDERLRELERAARATDADRDAIRAYARALDRSGDRRGFFLELAKLVRLGDKEAARDMSLLAPKGHADSPGRARRSIQRKPRIRDAVLGRPIVKVEAASEEVLVGTDGLGGVHAFDSRELAHLWSLDPLLPATPSNSAMDPVVPRPRLAFLGDDLLLGCGKELSLLDARSGRSLAHANLEGSLAQLAVAGDRAVAALRLGSEHALVAFDVGESFGAVLHGIHGMHRGKIRAGAGFDAFLAERHSDAPRTHELVAIGFDDARIRWRRDELHWPIGAIDARGIVLRSGDESTFDRELFPELRRPNMSRMDRLLALSRRGLLSDSRVERDFVRALNPEDGSVLWEVDIRAEFRRWMLEDCVAQQDHFGTSPGILLEDELVVISRTKRLERGFSRPEVFALDRGSGRTAWSSVLSVERILDLTLAGGLVYAVEFGRRRGSVHALQLGDGQIAFEIPLDPMKDRYRALVPLSGALLVVWSRGEDQTRITRIEEP
jgi:hypothetical protein